MTAAVKECKVCGKEYPYCKTNRQNADIFRWQDVACCQEHGSIYFAQIKASRSNDGIKLNSVPKASKKSIRVARDKSGKDESVE